MSPIRKIEEIINRGAPTKNKQSVAVRSQVVFVRVSPELLARVDAVLAKARFNRTDAVTELLHRLASGDIKLTGEVTR